MFSFLKSRTALGLVGLAMVALFIYLQPPIATGLSMLFLHERPGLRFWVAARSMRGIDLSNPWV